MKKNTLIISITISIVIIIIILAIPIVISGINSVYNHKKIEKTQETTENPKKEETIILQHISTYNNPIIPEGFIKVETKEASWELENGIPKDWNKGLVIEDKIGNQFVWVPIEEDVQVIEKEPTNYDEALNLQIYQYGGFYVARYEAGIPNEYLQLTEENITQVTNPQKIGIPTSKKNQIPWNYIIFKSAKSSAQLMYNTKHVKSDIITEAQWDYIVNWLEKCGYDTENSADIGNYSNVNFRFTGYYSLENDAHYYKYGENMLKQTYNMVLSTGATERNKTNNIYDLAGNLAEYAQTSDGGIVYVKGGYYDNHSSYSISDRIRVDSACSRQGFRVVLYLY